MSKTDYLENKLLDHITGKTAYAAPTVYVALFTAAPGESGGGTEVSGGGYARKSTAGTDWAAASGGSTSNSNPITFVSASGSWGTITHFALLDAATAGNMLRYGAVGTPKPIGAGDTANFPVGSLVLTED